MGTSASALQRALARVDEREADVRAWAYLDREGATAAVAAVDGCDDAQPLRGLVLGVKDVFDTADLPTEYGCAVYAGHRPRADAAAVTALRKAGAVCLGKTVTAELALFHPGPTRNPWRLTHTPGGSSSGSAAAVAAGMADVAIGTQTAGSIIRPASFCGVWGLKPTFGRVSIAGLKLVAPSLDTVGWFAQSADGIDAVRVALTDEPPRPDVGSPPRIGLARTAAWESADADCRAVVEDAAARARSAGATVIDIALPPPVEQLVVDQPVVQAYEAARSLAYERTWCADDLSETLRQILDWGTAIPTAQYLQVRTHTTQARGWALALFDDIDVLITPAVIGEAPEGLASTGDPRFARLWTLLGLPAVSVPGLLGRTGLPIGVQLVARSGADGLLVAWAEWLGRLLT
jgi:Asp-tRNA(Asn)/Glu-tRNA(Gln) amidotransferase A subunit family amidase